MRYIYMDNYRGFQDIILPLMDVNFLVGENSTGKSSFLKLINLFSDHQFWFWPSFPQSKIDSICGFSDIVSAYGTDKSSFTIGVVVTKAKSKSKWNLSYSIMNFIDSDGIPKLYRLQQLHEDKILTLVFEKKTTKYNVSPFKNTFTTEEEALTEFHRLINTESLNNIILTNFPKSLPPDPPIPIAASIAESLSKNKGSNISEFKTQIPFTLDLGWIAPIRSKPQRTYDGTQPSYTPEGDHAPFLLKKSLKRRADNSNFAIKIKEFGKISGMFDGIKPHSYSSHPQAPFEILVNLSNTHLNINNVGYGVSQVLPLLVDFITGQKSKSFAVQQPEVHLHPRAQAALGGLIYEMALSGSKFFVETHSDYLIDRFRISMKNSEQKITSQTIFFERSESGNTPYCIKILGNGQYKNPQPKAFRDFFIKEEITLLGI